MPVDLLLRLVSRDGSGAVSVEDLPETFHDIGVELDEITQTTSYTCRACGAVMERTEAQGAPAACAQCGVDFRENPKQLETGERRDMARLDMVAVRPDIFDPGGMARYIRGFMGFQTGLIEYPVREGRHRVKVDPALATEESYRPFIACAVLRELKFDDERIRMLMNLQEDLHWALGRDRKLASIGVYDLATLRGENFAYDAVPPDGVRFVPLGFDPAAADAEITPAEILERHKTGQEYAHLLAAMKAYPLLRDGEGAVLSMPPIINSEATRVTQKTRECFVDVTGLSQRTVDRALNIVVTSLKEVIPSLEIESVTIESASGSRVTPDLKPADLTLRIRETRETVGIADATTADLKRLLERMGHGVAMDQDDGLRVSVPAWRNDVMHPIDLIEDVAIAYGYDKLVPTLVPSFTIGVPREIEERSAVARRIMTGLGLHQVITLTLTSEPAAFEKWSAAPDPRAVRIDNPISSEQTMCRVSLLPGLLETLAINRQYDLPQSIFEVGDCAFVDEEAETGAREERFVAAAIIGPHAGYADVRALTDAFAHEMAIPVSYAPGTRAGLIEGRTATVLRGESPVGVVGEVHPEVLERYNLRHAVAVVELNLAALLASPAE